MAVIPKHNVQPGTKPVRLTSQEIANAEDGMAVVTRPQPDGAYLVAVVDVSTGVIRNWLGASDKGSVSDAIGEMLRWVDKAGMPGPTDMSSRSRDRRMRSSLIRLASEKPELRPYLLPILKEASNLGEYRVMLDGHEVGLDLVPDDKMREVARNITTPITFISTTLGSLIKMAPNINAQSSREPRAPAILWLCQTNHLMPNIADSIKPWRA